MPAIHFPGFEVADVEHTDGRVRIGVSVDSDAATCPDCGRQSTAVHSTYVRQLRDLPILGEPVELQALVCRVTVRKYLQHTEVPERAPRPQIPGKITPLIGYLKQRWETGCHNASQLFKEIGALGYDGSRSLVKASVQPWRTHVDTRVAPGQPPGLEGCSMGSPVPAGASRSRPAGTGR